MDAAKETPRFVDQEAARRCVRGGGGAGEGFQAGRPVSLHVSLSCARTCVFTRLHMPVSSGEDVGGRMELDRELRTALVRDVG